MVGSWGAGHGHWLLTGFKPIFLNTQHIDIMSANK